MGGKLRAKMVDRYGPGRHGDGTGIGLALVVQPSGSRSWVQRLVVRGRRVLRGLGSARAVRLSQAREYALENYRQARRGLDPFRVDAAPDVVPTLEQAANETAKHYAAKWSDSTRKVWMGVLRRHVFPKLGSRPVTEITKDDVVGVLLPVWESRATGTAVLRGLRQVFGWCRDHDKIRELPTDTVATRLPARGARKTKSHAAVPVAEVPEFLRRVEDTKGAQVAKDAIRLCVLTACRPSEIRLLEWAHVDFDARLITLPETATKQKREHTIPLSTEAARILETRPRTGRHVFVSPRTGRAMSPMGLDRTMQAAAPDYTLHGTARSSFSTWAHETGRWPHDAVEGCLGHLASGSVVSRSYNRARYDAERREIMDGWAAHCLGA